VVSSVSYFNSHYRTKYFPASFPSKLLQHTLLT
jgi:hypothetical protein